MTQDEVLDHSPSNSVGVTGIIFNLLEEAVTRRFGAGAWAEMLAKVDVGGYLPFDRYPDDDLFRLLAVLPVAAEMDAEERLRAIRELKDKGYSLKAIAGLLTRQHADAQRSVPPLPPAADDEHLAPQELADRTRVPLAVLRSLEASGVIRARQGSGGAYYTGADVRAVKMLLSLLGVGLPMEEFMQLARLQIATMQEVAGGAVQLYTKYVVEPLRAAGLDPHEEGERAEAAFGLLVQAATSLVAYGFERMLRNAWAAEKAGAA